LACYQRRVESADLATDLVGELDKFDVTVVPFETSLCSSFSTSWSSAARISSCSSTSSNVSNGPGSRSRRRPGDQRPGVFRAYALKAAT